MGTVLNRTSTLSQASCIAQGSYTARLLISRCTSRGLFDESRLGSSASLDHYGNSKSDKFEVFPKSLPLKIINIQLDHVLKGHLATCIDLPGACQSWLPRQSQHIMWTVTIDFIRKRWAWTNERHFTSQNIKELGEFIYTSLAKKSANFSNPGIVNILI